MGVALILGVNTAIIGFIIYVLFIASNDNPIRKLAVISVPNHVCRVGRRVVGDSVADSTWNFMGYVLYRVLYLVLLNGSMYILILDGLPQIPNCILGPWHRVASFFSVGSCLVTFALACIADPGVLTPESILNHDNYPFDGVLFSEGKTCYTCETAKLARSKHCNICGHCVARFDHHCTWLNSCIGENNYRVFLLFLWTNAVTFFYESYVIVCILVAQVKELGLFDAVFVTPSGERLHADNKIILLYMLKARFGLMTVGMLASTMAVTLTIFGLYHMRLIFRGVTTNESAKWADANDYYTHIMNTWMENMRTCNTAVNLMSHDGAGPLTNKKRLSPTEKKKRSCDEDNGRLRRNNNPMNNLMDKNGKNTADGLRTPYSSEVAITSSAPKVPHPHPGDMPSNVYNIGIWGNLGEVLWPRNCRPPQKRKGNWGNALETSQTIYWQKEKAN